ncbi:MAG TPA: hypothetical protein VL442_07275 [Mucilaginibacter sp.]|jgi:hypothetical protein|nr:hypothetical protein [Mucilaginibacter sp.]
MKKIILSLVIALSSYCSYAQWSNGVGTIYPTTITDKVGIGTTSPYTALDANSTGAGVARFVTSAAGNTSNIVIGNSSNWNYGVMGTVSGTGAANGDIYGFGYISNPNASFIPVLNWTSTGKVGIGTTSPSQLLQVNNGSTIRFQVAPLAGVWVNNEVNGGTSDSPGPLYLNYSSHNNTLLNSYGGNVGIGTISPAISLEVAGDPTVYGGPAYQSTIQSRDTRAFAMGVGGGITFAGNYTALPNNTEFAGITGIKENNTSGDYAGALAFSTRINGATPTERMRITSVGNVLIGKVSQQPGADYKLDIGGSARANEIVVNTTGADFVFDKKYTLPKLSDVKAYIEQNQHLPEIPSAKEMQTNGLELGEMNKKLLQKMEELTLYLLEKEKQLTDQQTEIKQQNQRMATLEAKLAKIEAGIAKQGGFLK